MGTSSSNRIHNVQLMADYIDGTIVRPGETFSFNESVGPRTVERGFLEGQMIIGSLLLPVDRRRRLPDGDDALQQRLRARPADPRAAQPQLLHLALPARARRDGLVGRARLRVHERPEDGDPDQDELHRLDADVQLLRHRSGPAGRRDDRRPKVNWRSPQTTYALDPYAPRGSVRTVAGSNQSGFDVTVTPQGLRAREAQARATRSRARTSPSARRTIYGPGRSIPGPYFVLPRV